MNVLSDAQRGAIYVLAGNGASLRAISRITGHSTNTIRGYLASLPPDRWVGHATSRHNLIRAVGMAEACERCGYSTSAHLPSYRMRRYRRLIEMGRGNDPAPPEACPQPVRRCDCGGWRTLYSAQRCRECFAMRAIQRRQQWVLAEPERQARRELQRQRRLLREGAKTLTAIRKQLHGHSPSRPAA